MPKRKKSKIEIHQNTLLNDEQFHVIYKGNNGEITVTSEKLPTIQACKKNMRSLGKLFNTNLPWEDVDVYKDGEFEKSIKVKF